jgi:uncharacterized membrane protein YtjA (UPF0391 family)
LEVARLLLVVMSSARVVEERPVSRAPEGRRLAMLGWVLTFIVIAAIAALFGFGGIAASAAWFAKVLFVLFLVLAVVALLLGRKAPV